MEVLAYQAFIFVTIFATRFVAPNKLFIICTLWSAFTLIHLFYPPLIVVQLIVIWGSYALFSPKENPASLHAGKVVAKKDLAQDDQPVVLASSVKEPSKSALSSIPKTPINVFGTMLVDMERALNQSEAAHSATHKLKQLVDGERIHIEAAYAAAVREVDHTTKLAAYSPEARAVYEQSYNELAALLRDGDKKSVTQQPLEVIRSPVFDPMPLHVDALVQAKINSKVEALRTKREAFIRDIQKKIDAKPEIYSAFIAALLNEATWPLVEIFTKPNPHSSPSTASTKKLAAEVRRDEPKSGSLADQVSPAPKPFDAAIRACVEKREVPYLVHFTRIENLRSIMLSGLLPVATLNERKMGFMRNDHARYDGRLGATSLSIAHTNDRMFYKYRQENPNQDWAVLKLKPSILWSHDVAFCPHNAADNRVSKRPLDELKTPSAFEAMFASTVGNLTREDSWVRSFDPTDVQAEVLIFQNISSFVEIDEVVFNKPSLVDEYRECTSWCSLSVDANGDGLFGARQFSRRSKAFH